MYNNIHINLIKPKMVYKNKINIQTMTEINNKFKICLSNIAFSVCSMTIFLLSRHRVLSTNVLAYINSGFPY